MGSSKDKPPPAPGAGAAAHNAKLVDPNISGSRPLLALNADPFRLRAQAHPTIAAGA